MCISMCKKNKAFYRTLTFYVLTPPPTTTSPTPTPVLEIFFVSNVLFSGLQCDWVLGIC